MKIIDAVWEERNLGVTCAEIEIDKDDNQEQIIGALRNRNEQYIVVKVASENPKAMFTVQSEGFVFVENLIQIELDLQDGPYVPKICRKLIKNTGFHRASSTETAQVLDEIKAGVIFATDRISIDPYFSRKKAGERYAYWIEDILSSGNSELIITEYLEENIGFLVIQHKDEYSSPVLNGLFKEFLGSGLGFVNSYCSQKYLIEKGVKRSVSHISTNNTDIFKMSLLFNNSFTEVQSVFIKHQ